MHRRLLGEHGELHSLATQAAFIRLTLSCMAADPYSLQRLPEVIEEYLDHGQALCIAFNRRGTILAGEPLPKPTGCLQIPPCSA